MTLDSLVNELPKNYTPQDIALVRRAFELATIAHEGRLRKSGEAYIEHPLEVARILANLRLDSRTIAAALLHDVVEDAPTRVPDLTAEFGAEVASLVDGVTKLVGIAEMANLPAQQPRSQGRESAQNAAGDGRRRARRAHQAGGPAP